MHSALIINSHFVEGTPLRTDQLLLGWEKLCDPVSHIQGTNNGLRLTLCPCPDLWGESGKSCPQGSPFLSPAGLGGQWEGAPEAGLGGEHRWCPLCPL